METLIILGLLFFVGGSVSRASEVWGSIVMVMAALCYGIAAHYTRKRLTGASPLLIATGTQIGAAVLLLAPALYFWPTRAPSLSAWLFALVLGVVCTGLAYILYFRLIARTGAARAIAVTYLIPVFGMGWGWTFLGERISASMVLGCAVILLGIAMATGVVDPVRNKPRSAVEPF